MHIHHRSSRHRRRALVASAVGTLAVLASATHVSAAAPGSWTPTTTSPTPRYEHVATRLADGRVLVAGGMQDSVKAGGFVTSAQITSTEIYDPNANTWTQTAPMSTPRALASAVTLSDGRVLVAGGGVGPGTLKTTEIYTPASGKWTAGPGMLNARSDNLAIRLADGKVLAAGRTSTGAMSAEVLDPAKNKWTATGPTSASSFPLAPRGVLLGDGRVFTTMGLGYYGGTPTIYNPKTNVWAPAPTPPVFPGFGTNVTLLANGHVLLAGGATFGSWTDEPSNVVLEFDPIAATWTTLPSANFTGTNGGTRLTTLTNGLVLASGGNDDRTYDPSTATWSVAAASAGGNEFTLTSLADGRALKVGGNTTAYPTNGVGIETVPFAATFRP